MEAALAPPEVPPLALGLLDECDGLAAGLLGAALGSGWVTLGSVWQCVAVCVAVCGSVRQCVWQCVWQCAAVCGSVWQTFFNGASFLLFSCLDSPVAVADGLRFAGRNMPEPVRNFL
jgi:hypothetical protein